MSTQFQLRRGNTTSISTFTGAIGEVIFDTTQNTLVVQDGTTPGGHYIANKDYSNTVFVQANSAFSAANSASSYANGAFLQANAAYAAQNTTGVYANNAWTTANTKVSKSGDTMTGNLNITTATVLAGNVQIQNQLYTGYAAGLSTYLPNLIAQFTGTSSNYVQVNIENINQYGSGDYVVTADVGNDTTFYVDFGIQGSQNYDSVNASAFFPLDGYVYAQGNTGQLGGNLIVGTTSSTSGLQTKIISGGSNTNNIVATFDSKNTTVYGNLIVQSTNVLSAMQTTGTYANTALQYANSAGSYANSAHLAQNTTGVYANTALQYANSAGSYANSAYAAANNVAPQIQPAFNQANAAYIQANSAYLAQNSTGNYANSAYAAANGAYANANAAFVTANSKVSKSGDTMTGTLIINTGSTQSINTTGPVYVGSDLTVTGNINLTGSSTTYSSNIAVVQDAMIYLAANNTGDAVDIGFYGHFVGNGSSSFSHYQHTGFARDYNDKKWKLFSNVPEPSASNSYIDFTYAIYDTLKVGTIEAVTANINNYDLFAYATNAYNQANAAYLSQNTTGVYANTALQYANSAGSYANSAYLASNGSASYANSTFQTITNTNIIGTYANTALQYANSAGSYANSAYAAANNVTPQIQPAFNQANASYNQANTATQYAQSAGSYANTALQYANSAGSYANSAYALANASASFANSTFQTITNTNIIGTYANGAYAQANAEKFA
mgnify:CR=1 FL=1